MAITVGRLWHHPVKSMQGEEVREVVLGPGGLVGDRAYGFVDIETERLVSAKHPKRYGPMLECRAVFAEPPRTDAPPPPIRVTFPDGTTVDGDEDEITARVSALLGRDVRLVTSVEPGVPYEEVWPELEGFGPDALADALEITASDEAGERIVGIPAGLAAPGTLLDIAPLQILTTSTLATLSAGHPGGVWDDRRFRPNILLDDGAGNGEFGEDSWMGHDLKIGDEARIHVAAPTPRCIMITLAQPGLERDHDILRTVARANVRELGPLGKFACAGAYAEVVQPGVVRTGDSVEVCEAESEESVLAGTLAMLAAGLRG